MSAQSADDGARAPLSNGVAAGTSYGTEVEAETAARGSGPVQPTGSEIGQEAGRGGGNEGGDALGAQTLPAASTTSASGVMREGRRADASAADFVEQGADVQSGASLPEWSDGVGAVAWMGYQDRLQKGKISAYRNSLKGHTRRPKIGLIAYLIVILKTVQSLAQSGPTATEARTHRVDQPTAVNDVKNVGEGSNAAILEALTRNLTSLQELQVKSMKRELDGEESPEQVKTSTVSLPLLPGPEVANAGMVLQDWMAQVAVPMQDLSMSSGAWWTGVVALVRDAYSKWLAATPLERLQLEPSGHETWTSAKWTRVNSRACSLILQSIVETVRLDLVARRAVQSAPLILFRLHTCYQPGGASERSAVLGNLQNPVQPSSLEEALIWLRSWPRWVQRCKDLNMIIPDGTILAKALTSTTMKYMMENPDTHFRTQLLRSSLRIDGQPAFADVVKYHQHLQAEVESMLASRTVVQVATPTIKALGRSTIAYYLVITGEPVWTLESLLQAAAKVAGAPPAGPKPPSMNVLALKKSSSSDDELSMFALVDSGATHALRRANTQEEWNDAEPVTVNLAGGESVGLRMNTAGTILVPVSSLTSAGSTTPIVPLGALVSQLGYTMIWGKSKCRLEGRNGEQITLRVREGCPEVTEHEALKLISQLEDARLQELRNNTTDTRTRVKAAALAMEKTWFDHLLTYVDSGLASEAMKAVEGAPFLQEVPRPCKAGLCDAFPEANGWQALKGLEHLNRRTRKKLWSSNQWVVHLFSGKKEKRDLYHLEGHGYAVLELDIERGRSQDLLRSSTWRALEYGARKGKIAAIVGGPPQGTFMISRHIVGGPAPVRSNDYPFGNWDGQSDSDVWEVNRETQLLTRMIYLHALSSAGRIRSGPTPEFRREVAFLLEHPRDPRGFLKFQDPLYPDVVSFWRTSLWTEYAMEAGLSTQCFDMAALGKAFPRHTTIGTNLALRHLNGLRMRWHTDGPAPERSPACVWPTEFIEHVVIALREWAKVPRMFKMSADQWREHVRRGHLPFRADCAVCVQAGATGRRHSRVEHPSAFVLSADLSGPVKVGGVDPDGRGAYPKQFKYIFAAKLRVPRSFVEDGRGAWVDYDPGELAVEAYEEKDDGLESEIGERRVPGERGERSDEDGAEGEPELKEVPRRDHEEDLDLAGPELVNLIFACGLKDDKSATVLEAIQDVVLYCKALNIPVLRFHTDRGMEFRARATRQWLKSEGIRVTTSEAGVHQTNGAAESTIRWLKQRARTLLLSAGLPQHLWASAISTAASMQRGDVLGFEPNLAAPYGAKVMVRKRQLEGPKLDDLAPKWVSGVYVGLSDSLSKGDLVYVKDDDGERFIHTLHVRAGLHDPGPVDGDFHSEFPDPPERRVRGKSAGSGDVVGVAKAEVIDDSVFKQRAEALFQDWSQEEAESLVKEVARVLPEDEKIYGMFRHGGRLGVTRAAVERPWFAKLLAKLFKVRSPDAEFAAVYVSVNAEREVHIDKNNAIGAVNHILPLSMPKRGGELWMELRNGDVVSGKVIELISAEGRARYGCAFPLQEGNVFTFDPHRRHAVLPWKGERIAVIGYTPGLLGSLPSLDKEMLWDWGFPLPLDDGDVLPEVYINALSVSSVKQALSVSSAKQEKRVEDEVVPLREGGWQEVIETSDGEYLFKCEWAIARRSSASTTSASVMALSQAGSSADVLTEHWNDCEMQLVLSEEREGASTAVVRPSVPSSPLVRKTEVAYTDGVENILENLASPLSVVYTVNPREVVPVFERWTPSLMKEVASLEHAVDKVMSDDPGVREDLASGRAQLIPMKVVYTVKPPDPPADGGHPEENFKRKARIVICGNMASHQAGEVYASTAPAEIVRAAIALARFFNWNLGLIDIVAAFLQTPFSALDGAPLVYGVPPKVLVRAGICRPGELWRLTHAVYGLQESPRLWGSYRDMRLAQVQLVVDGKRITLLQGRVEPSWWSIMQEGSVLIGILVVYVDDLLLCARTEVIKELAAAIQFMWRTSPLQLVSEGEIRFLGIEISRTTQGFALSQKSYLEELLRLHEVPTRKRDLVPVGKESVSFTAGEDEAPQDEAEVRAAQQIAGELLWISQRTRPDVAFVCSVIGSLATRAPRRALEIGLKTLAYLQRTSERRLLFEGNSRYLAGFVDASFAPDANRSHTGWIIQLAGNVIAWRSSRQSCVSLSTAEAELEAAVEGLVAIQGIQAVLQDIGAGVFAMQMHSDSTSALAIAHGSCSWRTRHLRLKSAWISELIAKNLVEFNHCHGEVQPADMLTKPLSSARIKSLSCLIGLLDEMVLIALLVLAQAVSGERVHEDHGVVVYGSGVSVDYGLVTWLLFWCLVLVGVLSWEALKWVVWMIYDRAAPGSTQRRLRRLQRLRDATAEAIHREVSARVGSRAEQRARDSRDRPRDQLPDPPREHRDPHAEERMNLLRRLAQGVKETKEVAIQTTAFTPVHGPSTRVILRYVHEPPEATYVVPDNDCFHVYDDCHAFRHRGTLQKVERRRLCRYCSNRANEDPDKTPDYGRDLERAREYERVFNTTLTTSGQSSRMAEA
ncbi:unnamed protein product [Symbiodinium sp. CCMP2592]|nr:unnamed protein product [Symbiodinium sp. CCMP2592]